MDNIYTTGNSYLTTTASSNDYIQILPGNGITIAGTTENSPITFQVNQKKFGVHPELYFKYIKKKFGMLDGMRLSSRLKKLEKAFHESIDGGQEALGEKMMHELLRETRESVLYAKGIRLFIERQDINKHKHNIRDGHISDTLLKNFTRIIPKNVLEKKRKYDGVFDDFVVFHYWNEEANKKIEEKQRMTADEKNKMRDPVLFGIIRETDRLYFIADWEDEFCDLTFEEMVDVIGKDDNEITLSKEPKL